ncbi:MAG: ZIP family metal transporter [Bacteroidales bacterium]|nr:ZIP family metal transporter [Bacteroidales bacterium]MEE0909610.1 ZIP family metal transporter [Bacteroidales bacterium]MEE0936778.1 ZIP family metal transporter [Bacteroidales bacterium]
MLENVLVSAAGLCGATILGSLIGFSFKRVSHKWNDIILGYCAGIMLAAAILGLIIPASESVSSKGLILVFAGVIIGALFLNILDKITPHLHSITGLDKEEHHNNAKLNHILLFVMAIAIHKLPEGMAAGVGFNSNDIGNAWNVTLGISIQNIPEGIVIISPLLLAGVSRIRTFLIALSIALLEIVGVLIGFWAGGISQTLLPLMLSFAGGAMLYVVSDEMIPETHAHGFQKQATYALLLGFLTLLATDRLLTF